MTLPRFSCWLIALFALCLPQIAQASDSLEDAFVSPPPEARPGVYWYFMDGTLTKEGITGDLESMKEAGIGSVLFLEIFVGVPRGEVHFMSDEWQERFKHAVLEAERLGIDLTLGSGPGWAGSGGPWLDMEQTMQHLVAKSVDVKGPSKFNQKLPTPDPNPPYFGYGPMTPELRKQHKEFYKDVSVLAFPTPTGDARIDDLFEKSLVHRAPYSSRPNVKPYLPMEADYPSLPTGATIDPAKIIDLTDRLQEDGTLQWDVPAGNWTIMRFGTRSTGATTRPAPKPGLGFECDKLDAAAFDAHFANYAAKLLDKIGHDRIKNQVKKGCGWTMMHIDSWEMGSQNWTPKFREEFQRRRGYDPQPYLPCYSGLIVNDLEKSERFLWDMRQTANELVLENHANHMKKICQQYGFKLSIEPYDMNPTADLDLGAVADIPMCEFWSEGYGFNAVYSCIEATSIAHILGRPVVGAESFTSGRGQSWRLYPTNVKNQGDWAFCTGINRFVYHTFAHKPQGRKPGMTMAFYGVNWDRGQTWWPMASAYHKYVTRCQSVLRQGRTIADICYLAAEGAPHVFRPPLDALQGEFNPKRGALGHSRDRKGYNFDGCSPTMLEKASVRGGNVVFPSGAEYRILVLPAVETMTPELLAKVKELIEAGATVIGPPPQKSPSLVNYPECDQKVATMANAIWGQAKPSASNPLDQKVGKGRILAGGDFQVIPAPNTPLPTSIEKAKWIWHPEKDPARSAKPGSCDFYRTVTINPNLSLKSAKLEIASDNSAKVWVNTKQAGENPSFSDVSTLNLKGLLKPGENHLTIQVENSGDTPNPAGLIASLSLKYDNGEEVTIATDKKWSTRCAFTDHTLGDTLTAAKELGPVGMSPWNLKPKTPVSTELYPKYDATARLLKQMGCLPDFEADGPVRYTHRRTEDADIYFVANQKGTTTEANCTFRIAGRQPELWDPVHGTMRDLSEYTEADGRTTIPMRFEPDQSFFVVFRKKAADNKTASGKNFPTWKTVQTLTGPWDVAFDPSLKGPQKIQFEELQDWTKRSEHDIKHYSGQATYSKTFDLPASLAAKGPIMLDLGTVHNMARVRLNGQDLGIVWCAPWQVDISKAVKPKGNRLEIDVVNLWPNRMIANSALPKDDKGRVGWTTNNIYKPDDDLLPSGLLGPVKVKIESQE